MKFRRAWVCVSAALLTLSTVTACSGGGSTASASGGSGTSGGGGSHLTPVNFQLNWTAGGFNAGFELALQNGYYRDQGLDVHIIKGNGSSTTAQLVASGNADLAYADAVPVMQLIDKGAKMKVVSTIYQANPNEVTALKGSGITKITDLKGKSVGVPSGASQTPMLPLLFQANGMSKNQVKLVNMPTQALVPSLLQHRVDAILGSMDFYGIELKQQGAKTVNFPFADYGVPTVSTSMIASDQFLQSNPDVVKGFIAASLKGWAEALQHPQEAVDAVVKTFPDVKKSQTLMELEATKSLLCKNNAKFIGKAEPAAWAKSQQILAKVGSLPSGVDPTKYYTYSYLPTNMPSC